MHTNESVDTAAHEAQSVPPNARQQGSQSTLAHEHCSRTETGKARLQAAKQLSTPPIVFPYQHHRHPKLRSPATMTTTRNPFDALGEDYDPSASLNKPVAPSSAKPGADEPKEILAKQTTSKKRDPSKQTAGESRRGTEYSSRGGAARGGKSRGPQNANEQYSKDKGTGHDANAAKPIEDTVSRGTARGRGRGRGSG